MNELEKQIAEKILHEILAADVTGRAILLGQYQALMNAVEKRQEVEEEY